MRLLGEIIVIGALIYIGWEKPFTQWIHGPPPVVTATPAPAPRPIVRATATPSGEWMWDPAHDSVLDRPAYKSREPSKRYLDAEGRRYWYDAKGVRHYDP